MCRKAFRAPLTELSSALAFPVVLNVDVSLEFLMGAKVGLCGIDKNSCWVFVVICLFCFGFPCVTTLADLPLAL